MYRSVPGIETYTSNTLKWSRGKQYQLWHDSFSISRIFSTSKSWHSSGLLSSSPKNTTQNTPTVCVANEGCLCKWQAEGARGAAAQATFLLYISALWHRVGEISSARPHGVLILKTATRSSLMRMPQILQNSNIFLNAEVNKFGSKVTRVNNLGSVSSPLCVWKLERVRRQTQLCQLKCI